MNSLKIGLVGCGKQAPKHINGLKNLPGYNCEIIVADIDQTLASKLADEHDLAFESSSEALLEREDVDAIDICTPVPTHYDLCLKAFEAGKHVFCEKPLVTELTQARSLNNAREVADVVCAVGYIYRFVPEFSEYKRLSKSKSFEVAFGQPVYANLKVGGRGSHQVWKHQKNSGGGAINEMLVHMVDLALWFFGPVDDVNVLTCDQILSEREINGQIEEVDAEDLVAIEMKTQSGVHLHIQADMLTPCFTQYVEIQGTKGTFNGSIQSNYSSGLYLAENFEQYTAGMNKISTQNNNLFQLQMAEFVHAIGDRSIQVTSSVQDSINLLEVMNQIN